MPANPDWKPFEPPQEAGEFVLPRDNPQPSPDAPAPTPAEPAPSKKEE